MKCKCKVCEKEFQYGDEQSPMLSDKIWNDILDYYSLKEYEIESNTKFFKAYSKKRKFVDSDDMHCYICYKCMEKALGRKLTRDDLIGKDVPLNCNFEKFYDFS